MSYWVMGFRSSMNLRVLSISLVLELTDETLRVSWFTLYIFSPHTSNLWGFSSLPDNAEPQFRDQFVLLVVQQKDGKQRQ